MVGQEYFLRLVDVTRQGIRYSVVQPADKISEGFDMAVGEITELKIEQTY